MKVAILGDFHLGYPRFYEDSFSQAEQAFARACEMSDLVVLVGDIFDTKTPKMEVIERALRIFGKAKEKRWSASCKKGGLPVVAIHGTHERRHKDSVNAIQLLESAGAWMNIHNSKVVFSLGNENVAVHGLGGVPEEYAAAAMKAANFAPEKGAFNILVFHQSLKELIPGGEEMLCMEDLPPGFDVYACGHMHKNHSRKAGGGELIIPGSTVITQMRKDETGRKGFVLLDTKTKEHQFIEVNSRPFFFREIGLKDANPNEVRKKASEAIEEFVSKSKDKPIIKLKLTGTLAKGFKSSDIGLISDFSDKAFLDVDIGLEDGSVSSSRELLRGIRDNKLSVRSLGLEMLKKKMAEAKCPTDNVETLFDRLAEGKSEEIAREMAKKKE